MGLIFLASVLPLFNPLFSANMFFIPLKISENLWFLDDFRRYKEGLRSCAYIWVINVSFSENFACVLDR